MRVGILGASNSLITLGWHSVLTGFFNVEKYAVGGSTSGIGIYKALEHNLAIDKDVVFLNFGVSEHEELFGKHVSARHMKLLIGGLYEQFANTERHFASVIFPIRDYALKGKRDFSYDMHKYSAISSGGVYIDGYAFLDKVLSLKPNIDGKTLFLDNHHLLPMVSRYIGHIAKDVASMLWSEKKEITNSRFKFLNEWSVVNSDSSIFGDLKSTKISNANFNESPRILRVGDAVSFDSFDTIHGVYVDSSNSGSKIKIESAEGKIVKSIFCRDSAMPEGKPQLLFCTFSNGFKCAGKTVISIADDNENPTETQRGERKLPMDRKALICGLLMSKDSSRVGSVYSYADQRSLQLRVDRLIDYYAMEASETLSSIRPSIKYNVKHSGDSIKKELEMLVVAESGLFDEKHYLDANPDVRRSRLTPVEHYCRHGFKERRSPCANFSFHKYSTLNKLAVDVNPIFHLAINYLKELPQAVSSGIINEFSGNDWRIRIEQEIVKMSGLFDCNYYYDLYPDVKKGVVDAVRHYCKHGFKEGRRASPSFDSVKYAKDNGLLNSVNPLVHKILSSHQ